MANAQLLPKNQQVSHAFSYDIQINNLSVGKIQTFSPTYSRTLARVRGLGQGGNTGETFEIVPGIVDYTVAVTNLELYVQSILDIAGGKATTGFTTINDLIEPINIVEYIFKPGDTTTKLATIQYLGCQVASYSKSGIAANGNVVTESVTFWVAKINRVPVYA